MSYRDWSREIDGKPPISKEVQDPWDDSKSIGAGTDKLPDGRDLKYDAWCECGYTFLTYTFSSSGLEKNSKEEIIEYLVSQGIKIDLNRYPLEDIEMLRNADEYQLTITVGESDE